MTLTVLIGTVISAASLLLPSPWREVGFSVGVGAEMILTTYFSRRPGTTCVHLSHLVERVGLLSIIVLGESVISLVNGLQKVVWTVDSIVATAAGFLIIGLIWWIYFDSFHILERAKRLKSGLPVLYANIFFVIGLALLANAIGYGIKGGLGLKEFRILSVTGILFYYLGKQIAYYTAIPIYRKNILINSSACVAISLLAGFLPNPAAVLCGVSLAMVYYVFSNYRWTLSRDASEFIEPHHS